MRRRFSLWMVVATLLLGAHICFAQSAEQLRKQLDDLQRRIETAQQRESEAPDRRATVIGSSRSRPKEETLAPSLVTRLYDLSDLFTVAPPYVAVQPSLIGPDEEVFAGPPGMPGSSGRSSGGGRMSSGSSMGGGMGGMGGGFFGVPSIPSGKDFGTTIHQMSDTGANSGMRTSMDQLVEVIKSTIRPDEWSNKESRVAVIGASLVVTASDEAHQQITALLDLFRQRWGSLKTVSLRVWWMWLSEAELNAALAGAPRTAPTGVFGTVTADGWSKVQQAVADGDRRGYSSVVTCYNGQTVFTLAGDQRIAVTGLTPTFGGDEKSTGVAYEPILNTIHNGAVLQVTPLATRNGKYIVLDIHSRVNLVDKIAPPPARAEAIPQGDPRLVAAAIERPALQTQRISTTLRVPVEQVTLVGGMTFGMVKDQNLYLFAQGSIQELRDDDDRTAPAAKIVPAAKAVVPVFDPPADDAAPLAPAPKAKGKSKKNATKTLDPVGDETPVKPASSDPSSASGDAG